MKRYTPEKKIAAVKAWQKLRISGLSGSRAASEVGISHSTLYQWELKIGRLPDPPRSRLASLRYGCLHVQMRQLQKRVIPLRPHEAGYVQDNIEATCKGMAPELRMVWQRALRKANATAKI